MTTLIRDSRARHAVGVRELARRCDVAAPTVLDWERSEAAGTIRIDTLERALGALGERVVVVTHGPRHSDGLERREQRLGLELHRAVAGKLVADPERVLDAARGRLSRARATVRGGAVGWVDEWARMIDDHDLGALVSVMLGTTQHDIDLRSVSPFTGLLTAEEREAVLERATAS
jgi:transcriptional regulator with XRE-family HTH domain